MDQLGAKFKQKREELDIPLAKARDETNIRLSYLKAIEEGRFEDVEQEVYLKGFLKIYANYLGLDEREILKEYQEKKREEEENKEAEEDLAKTEADKSLTAKLKRFIDKHQNKLLYLFMITILIVVIIAVLFVGLIVYNSFVSNSGELNLFSNMRGYISGIGAESSNQNILTDDRLEEAKDREEEQDDEDKVKGSQVINQAKQSEEKNRVDEQQNKVKSVGDTEAEEINLTIEAIGDSWVAVEVDQKSVFRGTITQGSTKSFSGQSITVQMSNAAGIKIIKNGEEFGPFGRVGEVVVKKYITN